MIVESFEDKKEDLKKGFSKQIKSKSVQFDCTHIKELQKLMLFIKSCKVIEVGKYIG
ncbi:hypothetical protein [Niallia taxi]|uniref:hypothetical protein n=1 Tax=Niallia taxi TaxID=2499688 RepID=UPI00254D5859|nr:hypothetical protein [Niallia taxi]MDK8641678.1 hypothetical protein [Niallia taxi]